MNGDTINVGVLPPGQTQTTTQTQPISGTSSSTKVLTPEQLAAKARLDEANANYLNAMGGQAPMEESDVAAQVNSQRALDASEARSFEDPFQPGEPASVTGNLPELAPKTSLDFNRSAEGGVAGRDVLQGDDPLTGEIETRVPVVGGVKGPQNFQQATDEVGAFQAQQKLKIAQATIAEQERIEAQKKQELESAMVAHNAAAEERAKAADIKGFWEDKSVAQRLLSAIAVGLGAYGAGLTGGVNHAQQMLQKEMELDFNRKQERLRAATEKMQHAGVKPEMILKFAEQAQKNLLTNQTAQLNALEAKGASMLAPFPLAQQKHLAMMAEEKAKQDEKTLAFYKEATERRQSSENLGKKVTTTDASQRQGPGVTEAESKKATYAKEILDGVEVIRKSPRLDDDDLTTINNNLAGVMSQAENQTKSLTGPAKSRAMKALGISPDTLLSGIPEEKQDAARAWMNGTGLVNRDQSGAAILMWEDMKNWQLRGPQPGESPRIYESKLKGLESYGDSMRKLAGPEAARRLAGVNDVKKPTAQAEPAKQKGLSSEDREAMVWAKAHPKDPRAMAITKRVAQKMKGGE